MSVVYDGETWTIEGVARDADGVALDLTGATVRLRIAGAGGSLIALATPATGTITDAAAANYTFVVSPAQQTAGNIRPGLYALEVQAELADSTVSVQAATRLVVEASLF